MQALNPVRHLPPALVSLALTDDGGAGWSACDRLLLMLLVRHGCRMSCVGCVLYPSRARGRGEDGSANGERRNEVRGEAAARSRS